MRSNLRLFRLGFFCALIAVLAATALAADGSVVFYVDVAPGFAIALQDSLTFPQAVPGQTVEAQLDVTVWSNIEWDLYAAVPAVHLDGQPVGLEGKLEVCNAFGSWRVLDHAGLTILTGQSPTTAAGLTFTVPVRFTAGFGDAPGTYAIQVEFTVVPKL